MDNLNEEAYYQFDVYASTFIKMLLDQDAEKAIAFVAKQTGLGNELHELFFNAKTALRDYLRREKRAFTGASDELFRFAFKTTREIADALTDEDAFSISPDANNGFRGKVAVNPKEISVMGREIVKTPHKNAIVVHCEILKGAATGAYRKYFGVVVKWYELHNALAKSIKKIGVFALNLSSFANLALSLSLDLPKERIAYLYEASEKQYKLLGDVNLLGEFLQKVVIALWRMERASTFENLLEIAKERGFDEVFSRQDGARFAIRSSRFQTAYFLADYDAASKEVLFISLNGRTWKIAASELIYNKYHFLTTEQLGLNYRYINGRLVSSEFLRDY
jgi:hypothetical protein